MLSSRIFAILCFMSAAIIYPSYAEIYKWKDAEGHLRYSDVPPKGDTKYEVLNKKKEANPLEINKVTNSQSKSTALDTKNAKETLVIEGKKQDKVKENVEQSKAATLQVDDRAAIDVENCQSAQSNLATYKNGGRIKRVNEKGEAAYLTDADIASAIKTAQKDVEKYCHG